MTIASRRAFGSVLAVATVVAGSLLPAGASHAATVAAVDDTYSVRSGHALNVDAAHGLLANDTDLPAGSSVALSSNVAHGNLSLLGDGAFSYTPSEGYRGLDGFNYCVVDPATRMCLFPVASVRLAVTDVVRISGTDRYATAAAVSAVFPPDADTVYVASGEVFADALSASSAASGRKGPVLLTGRTSLPASTLDSLKRLRPKRIVLLGGSDTVSTTVETTLRATGAEVTRVEGRDRYAVSAEASRITFSPKRPVVYVASGEKYPDALSGAAAAGVAGAPVLLTQRDGLPSAVMIELRRLEPAAIIVLGGADTVTDTVKAALEKIAPTSRVDGTDRYAVSAKVSNATFDPARAKTVYVATGEVFPDALSSSAAAVAEGGSVLLVSKSAISAAVGAELDRLKPVKIVVVGGSDTVTDSVMQSLEHHLR